MSEFDVFDAIGEIDDDLIKNKVRRKNLKRFPISIAAVLCAAVVIFIGSVSKPSAVSASSETVNSNVFFNKLDSEPNVKVGMFALFDDDFITMTEMETLDYFGVELDVDKIISKGNGDLGIYKNSERGIYYDTNSFEYKTENSGRFSVTLSKIFHVPFIHPSDYDGKITQSEINGVGITIFGFVSENGEVRFHSEILYNGVCYDFNSRNLSEEEYVSLISAIIADNLPGEELGVNDVHKFKGKVSAVDSNAGLLGITADDGECLTVYLSADEVKEYELNDEAELTYTGNPITIRSVWRQQINSISRLG